MTREFIEEAAGIYRLKVPFDDLYTSVFLVTAGGKNILVDCATTKEDVVEYIVPALKSAGIEIGDIDTLVVTHEHEDHAGGLPYILALAPQITVVTDVRHLAKGVSTYPLPGHERNFVGVLDERTRTLISGDGLQGAGVGKYRCYLADKAAYLNTLEGIGQDERIESILFSHAHEPWYRDKVSSRTEVLDCVKKCYEYIER